MFKELYLSLNISNESRDILGKATKTVLQILKIFWFGLWGFGKKS